MHNHRMKGTEHQANQEKRRSRQASPWHRQRTSWHPRHLWPQTRGPRLCRWAGCPAIVHSTTSNFEFGAAPRTFDGAPMHSTLHLTNARQRILPQYSTAVVTSSAGSCSCTCIGTSARHSPLPMSGCRNLTSRCPCWRRICSAPPPRHWRPT